MCVLCSSHINKTGHSSSYSVILEMNHPSRGHVYQCQCGSLIFQAELVNETDCPQCGHQILSPGQQLASDPLLLGWSGHFLPFSGFVDENPVNRFSNLSLVITDPRNNE